MHILFFFKRSALTLALVFSLVTLLQAQVHEKTTPRSFLLGTSKGQTGRDLPLYKLPDLNTDSLEAVINADQCETCKEGGIWGYNNNVSIDLLKQGNLTVYSDGSKIWRYAIEASYAKGLQVHFGTCKISEKGELYIYNEDCSASLGAFTSNNNQDGGWFATQPITGKKVIVEYYEPAGMKNSADIKIGMVVSDFKGIYSIIVKPHLSTAAPCTDDVICKAGIPNWDKMVRSTAVMLRTSSGTSYSGYCTGTMLNNSRQDGTPYFITAKHCTPDGSEFKLRNALFMFDYQSATCHGDASNVATTHSVSGASLIVSDQHVTRENGDYSLLQLMETPPLSYKICYSGWDASPMPIIDDGGVLYGVHHASGDIKRIASTSNVITTLNLSAASSSGLTVRQYEALTKKDKNAWTTGEHYYKINWSDGVTANGASGSGLFNPEGNYIGTLHGGFSSCIYETSGDLSDEVNGEVGPDEPDLYGKFYDYFRAANMMSYLAPDWTNTDLVAHNYKVEAYCPYIGYAAECFNNIKDGEETGIDCGGGCVPCSTIAEVIKPVLKVDKKTGYVHDEFKFSIDNLDKYSSEFTFKWSVYFDETTPVIYWGSALQAVIFYEKGAKKVLLDVYRDGLPYSGNSIGVTVGDVAVTFSVDFSATPNALAVNSFAQFTAYVNKTSGAPKYEWSFGDDAVYGPAESTKASPKVSWSKAGHKSIRLAVSINDEVKYIVKNNYVYVRGSDYMNIKSDFNYFKPVMASVRVTFNDATLGANSPDYSSKWEWDFGDGSTSTEQHPTHIYDHAGTYTVKLKVTTSYGSASEKTQSVEVKPYIEGGAFFINDKCYNPDDFVQWHDLETNEYGWDVPEHIQVGYNSVTNFRRYVPYTETPQTNNSGCVWNLDVYGNDPDKIRTKCGPQDAIYQHKGEYLASLSLGGYTKAHPFDVVVGMGAKGCTAQLGNVSVSSTCWNENSIKFNVELKNTKCKIDFRIKSHNDNRYWPLNYDVLDYFSSTTIFPYTETFTVEAVQFDGFNYYVLDSRTITLTFHNSKSNIGNSMGSCPGLIRQIGVAPLPGKQYTWSSSPATALSFLDDASVSNPTLSLGIPGSYRYTLTVKDNASGCVGTSSATYTIAPVQVSSATYEVLREESKKLHVDATGGSNAKTLVWSPAALLSSNSYYEPVFEGTNTAGTYVYQVTATDAAGCSATGTQTVVVNATAPSSFVITPTAADIKLTWIDNAQTETAYVIHRSLSQAGPFTSVATLPPNTTVYEDKAAAVGSRYYYKVQAVEGSRNMGYTFVKNAIRQHEPFVGTAIGTASSVTKVLKLSDGNYLLVGSKKIGSYYDYYIAKMNTCGGILWEKTYGGNESDWARDVVVTPDGGFLIGGSSQSGRNGDRSSANRACEGPTHCAQIPNVVYEMSDYWVLKLNANGDKIWDRAYGGIHNDALRKIIPSRDGGYYLAGSSRGYPNVVNTVEKLSRGVHGMDYWIVKINANGAVQWERTYGAHGDEALTDLIEFSDLSYVIVGSNWNGGVHTNSSGEVVGARTCAAKSHQDIWMLKASSTGSVIWDKCIGGLGNVNDLDMVASIKIMALADGTYKLLASVNSKSGGNDIHKPTKETDYWLFNLNANFDVTGSNGYGGSSSDNPFTMRQSSTSTFELWGLSNSDASFDKTAVANLWAVEVNGSLNKTKDFGFFITGANPYEILQPEAGVYHVFYEKENTAYFSIYTDPKVYKPLATGIISPLAYYVGETMLVPFTAKGCMKSGNVYSVQLSDKEGSFDSPIVIGTLQSPALSGTILATIPFTVTPGNGYRVRVVSSDQPLTGTDNGSYITIKSPEITTHTITPLSYAPGKPMTVEFSLRGLMDTGNTFTVQLSDAHGDFASPAVLGSFAGQTAASYQVNLPNDLEAGLAYRVRVVSNAPAATGKDNNENIRIGNLFTRDPWQTSYYNGQSVSVAFDAIGSFNNGNTFTLQLSDANGSFASPLTIGTLAGKTSGVIDGKIPSSVMSGIYYKVRVVASDPAVTGVEATSELTVQPQTITTQTLASLRYLGGDMVAVPYTVNGTFASGNEFIAQLSNAQGEFTEPLHIGKVSAHSSGTITAQLPGIALPGNQYRIRVISTNAAITGTDNGSDISISGLSTGLISPLSYVSGQVVAVPYHTSYAFPGENVFYAQLSDAQGDFSNAHTIGYLQSDVSGTITASIPFSMPVGSGYRIRVVASLPAMEGLDNGQNISVAAPSITLESLPAAVLCREDLHVSYTTTGNFAPDNSFVLELADASGNFENAKAIGFNNDFTSGIMYLDIPENVPSGTYKARIRSSSPESYSNEGNIAVHNAYITFPGKKHLCANSTEGVVLHVNAPAGYAVSWYKDAALIAGAAQADYTIYDDSDYSVGLTDALGCTKISPPVKVVVRPVPQVVVSANPSQMCGTVNSNEAVRWKSAYGGTISGDQITINNPSVTVASALHVLKDKSSISYEIKSLDNNFHIGLGSTEASTAFNSSPSPTDYMFYFNITQGTLYSYKTGVSGSFLNSPLKIGDVVRIAHEGSSIKCYINTALVNTLSAPIASLWINVQVKKTGTFGPLFINRPQAIPLEASLTDFPEPYTVRWFNSKGTLATDVTSLNTFTSKNDPVKVEVTSSSKCGALVTQTPDISFQDELANAQFAAYPNSAVCLQKDVAIAWRDKVSVNDISNVISKSTATAGWNAGARSLQEILANSYVETKISGNDFAFGLKTSAASIDYTNYNYAFLVSGDGKLYVYESGVMKYNAGVYASGDWLHIGIEENKIVYYKNKLKVYTSLQSFVAPLYLNVCFNNATASLTFKLLKNRQLKSIGVNFQSGSTTGLSRFYLNNKKAVESVTDRYIYSAVLSANDELYMDYIADDACENKIFRSPVVRIEERIVKPLITLSCTNSETLTLCDAPDNTKVIWTGLKDVTVNSSGAITLGALASGGAYAPANCTGIEYRIEDAAANRAIGFSMTTGGAAPNVLSIDYSFENTGGTLRVVEKGVPKATYAYALTPSDVLKIAYEEGKTNYYINNYKMYTSAQIPFGDRYICATIKTSNSSLNNLYHYSGGTLFKFNATAVNAGTATNYSWYVNNQLVDMSSGYYQSYMLKPGDVVHAELKSNAECGDVIPGKSNALTIKSITPVDLAKSSAQLCRGQFVMLSAPSSPSGTAFTYQWYRHNVEMAGETNSQLKVATNGSYKVRVTNEGCSRMSEVVSLSTVDAPVVTMPERLQLCSGVMEKDIQVQADRRTNLMLSSTPNQAQVLSRDNYVDVVNDFSIEFWANPSAYAPANTSEGRYVLHPSDGTSLWGTGHAGIGIAVAKNQVRVTERRGSTVATVAFVNNLTVEDWIHVAVVYNNGTPSIFINGTLKMTGNKSVYTVHPGIQLGGGTFGYYDGGLDELRMWSRARSASEILQYKDVYLEGTENNLTGYWPMDEAQGARVADLSPNKNDITFIAGPGPVWQGYTYTWASNSSIIENYGSKVKVQIASPADWYKVTVQRLGFTNDMCKVQATATVEYVPAQLAVSGPEKVCEGKAASFHAERYLTFDGTNRNVACASFKLPDASDPLSIGLWVKVPAALTTDAGLFYTAGNTSHVAAYISAADKQLHFETATGSDLTADISDCMNGSWFYVLMECGDRTNPFKNIYINGALRQSRLSDPRTEEETIGLVIGSYGGQKMFNGMLRDFRVYKTLLPAEAKNGSASLPPAIWNYLQVLFPMNEGQGTLIRDESLSQHTGIAINPAWQDDDSRYANFVWNSGTTGHINAPRMYPTFNVNTAEGVFPATFVSVSAAVNECVLTGKKMVKFNTTCSEYNAAEFTAANQRIQMPFKPAYDIGSGDFTIEARVRLSSSDAGGPVVSARNAYGYMLIARKGSSDLVMQLNNQAGNNFLNTVTPVPNLYDGTCHHIAVIRESNIMHVIVDGQLLKSHTLSSSVGLFQNASSVLNIGYDRINNSFRGKVFEVRLWNKARTFAEINAHQQTVFDSSQLNLIGDWDMRENDGQLIYDRSSLNNTGVLGTDQTEVASDPVLILEDCASPAARDDNDYWTGTMQDSIEVIVYPNPFEEKGTDIFIRNLKEETSFIRIVSLDGTIIKEETIWNNKSHRILEDVKQGLYFVHVASGDEQRAYKVVKLY